MPVARYWGDPVFAGVASGFFDARERQKERKRQEELEKERRRKEKEQKIATGVGLGLGALGGVFAAPALGMGALAGGLTGAQLGAGLGQGFTSGDFSGFQKAAGSVAGGLARGRDRSENQAFRIAAQDRDRDLDFDNRIRFARETAPLRETGLTRSELEPVQQRYGDDPGDDPYGGGLANPPLLPPEGGGIEQVGSSFEGPPLDLPGPSPIPGMERVWGTAQYRQLAHLERERRETIDDHEWVARNGQEAAHLQRRALASRFRKIRTTTRPAAPKATIPTPDGQRIPMQLGLNDVPGVGMVAFDGTDIKKIEPTKQKEAEREYPVPLPDGSVYRQKLGESLPIPEWNMIRDVSENGKVTWTKIADDGPDVRKVHAEARRRLEKTERSFTSADMVDEAVRISREELAISEALSKPPEVAVVEEDLQRELIRIEEARARGDVIAPERLARLAALRNRWKELGGGNDSGR
jgi:hypothetical protein